MPRALSLAAVRSLTAAETDEIWVLLLTIEAPGLDPAIRVVNDRLPLTSRGHTFVAFPFEVDLPGDDAESVQRVTLKIDNVDRQIVLALRSLTEPPSVTLEVVRRGAPDLVEAGPFSLTLADARYDALVVEGDLVFEDVLNAAFPGDTYSPADYPGLF
jgi:hypothetical protein